MKKGWTYVSLGELCRIEKGHSPTMKTEPGEYPLVVTAAYRRTAAKYQFSEPAACIPIVSSTGHGNAAIHRIHYEEGNFALANLLVAAIPKDHSILDAKFLWYYLTVVKDTVLVPLMQGTANVTLRPGDLHGIDVLLPPLIEQQRIVARLSAIETRLSRVLKLRDESVKESSALLRALMNEKYCKGIRPVSMHEVVTWRSPDTVVSQTQNYRFAGVYSFGRGVFRKEEVSGMDFAYDRLTRLRVGEFTYPKLMAWEGALGVVPEDCDGCHVSPEFPVFTIDQSKVLPEILDIHFKTPAVWKKLADISTGTNLRRRRLNPNAFLGYQFPLPPMEAQKHIKRIIDQVKLKRAELAKVLEMEKALLPSLLDRIFSHKI